MNSGFIHIDNIPLNEVEKWKEIIGILIEKRVFSLENGKATLNFDYQGVLQEIEVNQKRFSRKNESLLNFQKFDTIKTNNP